MKIFVDIAELFVGNVGIKLRGGHLIALSSSIAYHINMEELKEIKGKVNKTRKERYQLLKKYHLSNKIKYWLEVMDEYSKYHDWRKEMQVRVNYSFYLLTLEVARRLKLKMGKLEWLWFDEIKKLLSGDKLDKKEINKREKAFLRGIVIVHISPYLVKESPLLLHN